MDEYVNVYTAYGMAIAGLKPEWLNGDYNQWYDYVLSLTHSLSACYLIITFENQVVNGGFHQYFINGYGQFANETIQVLFKIGARKKSALLSDALALVNGENYSYDIFREKLMTKKLSSLFLDDTLFRPLDELADKYYAIADEDIMYLVDDYLNKEQL